MSLRTSAHTGAAIRFPRRETWQTGTTLGKFVVLFRICPRRCFPLCCAARRTDCHVASLLAMTVGGRTCTRAHVFPSACHCEPVPAPGTRFSRCMKLGTTLGKFVVLFRICPRRCFLLCCAAEVTDCPVASLLAMTVGEVPSRPSALPPLTPGMFPRTLRTKRSCTR